MESREPNSLSPQIIPLHHASESLIIKGIHVPLLLLGLYNVYRACAYYAEVWRSLHQQGMGHTYLVVTTLMTSPQLLYHFLC